MCLALGKGDILSRIVWIFAIFVAVIVTIVGLAVHGYTSLEVEQSGQSEIGRAHV